MEDFTILLFNRWVVVTRLASLLKESTFLDQQKDISSAFRALRQSEMTGRPFWVGWLKSLKH